jgi:hypothetical protein
MINLRTLRNRVSSNSYGRPPGKAKEKGRATVSLPVIRTEIHALKSPFGDGGTALAVAACRQSAMRNRARIPQNAEIEAVSCENLQSTSRDA